MSKYYHSIIPCAGFGTRMNCAPNQSKEMLIDPVTNQPIINWSIKLSIEHGLTPIIISRVLKTDLNGYIQSTWGNQVILKTVYEYELEGKEWPTTVLQSKDYWREHSLLILPDTRFSPPNLTIEAIKRSEANIVFATHKVDDTQKWGEISSSLNGICYTEKPNHSADMKIPGLAWGLIGFHKDCGEELFKNMMKRGEPHYENFYKTETIPMKYFIDLTRTGVVESYP